MLRTVPMPAICSARRDEFHASVLDGKQYRIDPFAFTQWTAAWAGQFVSLCKLVAAGPAGGREDNQAFALRTQTLGHMFHVWGDIFFRNAEQNGKIPKTQRPSGCLQAVYDGLTQSLDLFLGGHKTENLLSLFRL